MLTVEERMKLKMGIHRSGGIPGNSTCWCYLHQGQLQAGTARSGNRSIGHWRYGFTVSQSRTGGRVGKIL